MTLLATTVELKRFRNYEHFSVNIDGRLTIVEGPNASGKTNLVESLQILTQRNSFRRASWAEIVMQGQPQAELSLTASDQERSVSLGAIIKAQGSPTFTVNGKKVSSKNGLRPMTSVVFTPDDLGLVKGPPSGRRDEIDALGSRLSSSYARLKSEYDRILRQRNSLLRQKGSSGLSGALDTQLIEKGAVLREYRERLFYRLIPHLEKAYSDVSAGGELIGSYIPSWERDGLDLLGEDGEGRISDHLVARRAAELSRATTLAGPHRDDLVFTVEGREARSFASQGQQRSVVLAWKIAEVAVVSEVLGQTPLLLLDDVMSELDSVRRNKLMDSVGMACQTVITTANLGYFEQHIIDRAAVVRLGATR